MGLWLTVKVSMESSSIKKPIPVIAIVGGIGSGKSTVAAEFARLGCTVLDADRMAHELLADPIVQQELVICFGPGIRDERGRIDRKKLAGQAFSSPENVQKINRILHPRVMEQGLRRIEQCRRDPACRGVILDAPLLLEAGWEGRYDWLVFVDCPQEVRTVRAARKGLDPEEVKKREFFQISLDKKQAMSHYIVQNNSDVFALTEQVGRIFTTMNDKR
jgi:dephospho-CoA kinase